MNYHNVFSMMSAWKKAFALYNTKDYDIRVTDTLTGENISVIDLIGDLTTKVQELQNEVNILKEENIENSNLIYELMNSLDAIDARIDIVTAERFIDKDV